MSKSRLVSYCEEDRIIKEISDGDSQGSTNVRRSSILKWITKHSKVYTLHISASHSASKNADRKMKTKSEETKYSKEVKRIVQKGVDEKEPVLLDINKNILVQFTYMPSNSNNLLPDVKGLPNYLISSSSDDSLNNDSDESLTINTTFQRKSVIRATDSTATFGSRAHTSKSKLTAYPYTPSNNPLPFLINDEFSTEGQPLGTEANLGPSDHEEVIHLPYTKSTNIVFFTDTAMSATPAFVTIVRTPATENDSSTPGEIPGKPASSNKYPFLPTSPIACQLPFKIVVGASSTNSFK